MGISVALWGVLSVAVATTQVAWAGGDGLVDSVGDVNQLVRLNGGNSPCGSPGGGLLQKDGEFSNSDQRCYRASLLPSAGSMPADGCGNLYAYVCGPRDTYDARKTADNGSFTDIYHQNEALKDAAADLWLTDHLPPHDVIVPHRSVPGHGNIKYTDGVLPATVDGSAIHNAGDLTMARIAALAGSNAAKREHLLALRARLFQGDGGIHGADAARCANGSIRLSGPRRVTPGIGNDIPAVVDDPAENRRDCAEAYRRSAISSEMHSMEVDVGFGKRPRAGEAVPSTLTQFNTGLAQIGARQGRTPDASLSDAWARTERIFEHTKADIIARINDPARTPNLSAAQRAQLARIVGDVTVMSPEAFKTSEGADSWDKMCLGGMNAAEDGEVGFTATQGPPLNGDGKFHRHAMIICPATVTNASDEWLQSVIAHEIGHSIDPGALARLNQRYFTADFQNDSTQDRQTRELYRDLAGGPNGGAPNGESRSLSQTLYGMASPQDDEYVWEGQWRKTSGSRSASDSGGTAGFLHTVAGCYESASKCPYQEWFVPGGTQVGWHGADACTTASGAEGASCNPGRCDSCFQIEHGQIEEVEADEVAARELADAINAKPATQRTPQAIHDFLYKSLSLHCYGGDPEPDGHPAGPARLNRIFGSSPELRAAMGCPAAPGNGPATYQTPCHSGYAAPMVFPRARCAPAGAGADPDFSASCPH